MRMLDSPREAMAALQNLMAVINRDGGQQAALAPSLEVAAKACERRVLQLRAANEGLEAALQQCLEALEEIIDSKGIRTAEELRDLARAHRAELVEVLT